MKKIKKILLLFGLCAVFVLGFTFPRIIGLVQDLNIQQGYEVVDAKPLQLAMNSNLTILEKLNVVQNVVSKVTLETAQKMDEKEAATVMQDQVMSVVAENEMVSSVIGFSFDSYTEKKHVIQLGVYDKNTVIVWNFLLEDGDGNQLQVLLDDDSGKILGLTYATAKNPIENQENWGSNRTGTSDNGSLNFEEDSSTSKSWKNAVELQGGISANAYNFDDSTDAAKSRKKKVYKKIYGDGILSQYAYNESDVEYIACQLAEGYAEYLDQTILAINLGEMISSVNGESYKYLLDMENPQDEEDSQKVVISLTDTQIQINM